MTEATRFLLIVAQNGSPLKDVELPESFAFYRNFSQDCWIVAFFNLADASEMANRIAKRVPSIKFVDIDFVLSALKNTAPSWISSNQGWIDISGVQAGSCQKIMNLILPYGATKSIFQSGQSWLVEFFDVRDAASAIKNIDRFVLPGGVVKLHIPLDRTLVYEENVSKTSRALSSLTNFQTKRADSDRFRKANKPVTGAWNDSQRLKMSLSSSILGKVDENWTLKGRSEPSFLSESNLQSYAREDKENDHVKSVEKSLNDWEGALDSLSTLGGDLMQSNEIDFGLIASGKDIRSTFMIRNIPNKYTQQMLLDFLNETHRVSTFHLFQGTFDFLYLRMDFKNKCNVGYAFINFANPKSILSLADRILGKKWNQFNSEKVATLCYANVQGREALIQKFRNSSVMLENPSFRPKLFYTKGNRVGEEEPFPVGSTKTKSKSDVLFRRE